MWVAFLEQSDGRRMASGQARIGPHWTDSDRHRLASATYPTPFGSHAIRMAESRKIMEYLATAQLSPVQAETGQSAGSPAAFRTGSEPEMSTLSTKQREGNYCKSVWPRRYV